MSLKVHSTVQEATVRFFSFRKKRSSTSSPSQSVQNSSKKVKTQVTKSSVSQQTSKVKSVTKKEKSIVKSIQKQKQKSVVKKELSKGKEVQSQGVEQKKEQVGHREFNMLQLQEQIQEAVEGIWSAPPGCTETAECTVVITVGWDGKVLHTEVQKSSGILIYDISVEHAVPKIQFPHAAWGKTFTLVFKP